MATTIQLDTATRERLARLKASPRETYDEVLNCLLALVLEGDAEGRHTQAFRIGLLDARHDIREDRLVDHDPAKRRWGRGPNRRVNDPCLGSL